MTIRMIGLTMASALVLLVAGCGKSDKTEGPTGVAESGASTGLAECDDYTKKMEACIARAAASDKPNLTASLKVTRESFTKNLATPEGKAMLKLSCKALAEGVTMNPSCK